MFWALQVRNCFNELLAMTLKAIEIKMSHFISSPSQINCPTFSKFLSALLVWASSELLNSVSKISFQQPWDVLKFPSHTKINFVKPFSYLLFVLYLYAHPNENKNFLEPFLRLTASFKNQWYRSLVYKMFNFPLLNIIVFTMANQQW